MSLAHIILAASGGGVFAVIVILIARRGILSMRYTLGWMFIAACITLGGVLGGLFNRVASALGIQLFALVVSLAAIGLLAITVQLSITVSGLTESVRTLAESVAILEELAERGAPGEAIAPLGLDPDGEESEGECSQAGDEGGISGHAR